MDRPDFGICPYCHGAMAFGWHVSSIVAGVLAGALGGVFGLLALELLAR